jgi:hypothetical protein
MLKPLRKNHIFGGRDLRFWNRSLFWDEKSPDQHNHVRLSDILQSYLVWRIVWKCRVFRWECWAWDINRGSTRLTCSAHLSAAKDFLQSRQGNLTQTFGCFPSRGNGESGSVEDWLSSDLNASSVTGGAGEHRGGNMGEESMFCNCKNIGGDEDFFWDTGPGRVVLVGDRRHQCSAC